MLQKSPRSQNVSPRSQRSSKSPGVDASQMITPEDLKRRYELPRSRSRSPGYTKLSDASTSPRPQSENYTQSDSLRSRSPYRNDKNSRLPQYEDYETGSRSPHDTSSNPIDRKRPKSLNLQTPRGQGQRLRSPGSPASPEEMSRSLRKSGSRTSLASSKHTFV